MVSRHNPPASFCKMERFMPHGFKTQLSRLLLQGGRTHASRFQSTTLPPPSAKWKDSCLMVSRHNPPASFCKMERFMPHGFKTQLSRLLLQGGRTHASRFQSTTLPPPSARWKNSCPDHVEASEGLPRSFGFIQNWWPCDPHAGDGMASI